MKIKITSDSTCDLSPELLRENDIELFPLFINKGDESFRDGVDIQESRLRQDDLRAPVRQGARAGGHHEARPLCRAGKGI